VRLRVDGRQFRFGVADPIAYGCGDAAARVRSNSLRHIQPVSSRSNPTNGASTASGINSSRAFGIGMFQTPACIAIPGTSARIPKAPKVIPRPGARPCLRAPRGVQRGCAGRTRPDRPVEAQHVEGCDVDRLRQPSAGFFANCRRCSAATASRAEAVPAAPACATCESQASRRTGGVVDRWRQACSCPRASRGAPQERRLTDFDQPAGLPST